MLSYPQLVEFHDHHFQLRLVNKLDLNCVPCKIHAQYFLNKYIFFLKNITKNGKIANKVATGCMTHFWIASHKLKKTVVQF